MLEDLSEQNHGCVDFFLSFVSSMIFAKLEKNERANERQLRFHSFPQRRTSKKSKKRNFMRHV
jgi:hypothetical protein